MKFKLWLENIEHRPIQGTDIYDFYYIASALPMLQGFGQDELQNIEFRINEIVKVYLFNLTPIVYEQVAKYYKQGRAEIESMDEISPDINPANIERLHNAMQQTWRSDMARRNDNWEYVTAALVGLSKAGSLDRKIFFIDRMNNAIHNTGESVMTKLPNHNDLLRALDVSHNVRTPKDIAPYVSGMMREIVPPTLFDRLWPGQSMPERYPERELADKLRQQRERV